jgi:hypothetical protein
VSRHPPAPAKQTSAVSCPTTVGSPQLLLPPPCCHAQAWLYRTADALSSLSCKAEKGRRRLPRPPAQLALRPLLEPRQAHGWSTGRRVPHRSTDSRSCPACASRGRGSTAPRQAFVYWRWWTGSGQGARDAVLVYDRATVSRSVSSWLVRGEAIRTDNESKAWVPPKVHQW